MNETLLLWIVAIAPGTVYVLIFFSYGRMLLNKRMEVMSIMNRGDALQKYMLAFGSTGGGLPQTDGNPEKAAWTLFDLIHSWQAYLPAILLSFIVADTALVLCLVKAGLLFPLPDQVTAAIRKMPPEAFAGIAGAFVWGVYDVLSRYRTVDLSPNALHFVWLRFVVAATLAPILGTALAEGLRPLLGFAIGAFPLSTIHDFVRTQAKTRFQLTGSACPAEEPSLHKLQGLTEGMLERLRNEGIESAQHMATADPMKLLLRTNIEWKAILDIIDQAILFCYLGHKIDLLRPMGIRGAIELAVLGDRLEEGDTTAQTLLALIAERLAQSEATVNNLIENLGEDTQVTFLWALWGEAVPETENPGE